MTSAAITANLASKTRRRLVSHNCELLNGHFSTCSSVVVTSYATPWLHLMRDTPAMLRELNVVEQRYQAVLQVLDGSPVTEVAERFGVARQTVHRWVTRYRNSGLDGLADRSHAPKAHPWRVSAEIEAVICDLRGAHRSWGPRRLVFRAGPAGLPAGVAVDGVPGLGPSPDDRAGAPPQAPGSVPQVGTLGGDGVVADGRDCEPVPGRRA